MQDQLGGHDGQVIAAAGDPRLADGIGVTFTGLLTLHNALFSKSLDAGSADERNPLVPTQLARGLKRANMLMLEGAACHRTSP